MVLQRDVPLTLKGYASPDADIRVSIDGHTAEARSDADGRWQAACGSLPACEGATLAIEASDGDVCTAKNVAAGDVWICSGQSNMAMSLAASENGDAVAAGAGDPGLRLLTVPQTVAMDPCDTLAACAWGPCTPQSARAFSAVGYYFGRALREAVGVPIGLILAAVGETPCEAWMSRATLEADPAYEPIFERWRESLALYPDPDRTRQKAFVRWDREADAAERAGRHIPGAHPRLTGPGDKWTPGGLFHGMIVPLTASPIRGVAWYQGAAAPDRAYQYRSLFRKLIQDWRNGWRQGDFPFLFVQEPSFGPKREEPCEHSWAELREAQAMALAEPNTAMAVSIDTGGVTDIHPVVKKPIGDRLALAARAIAYGENLPYSGPVFRAMRKEGDAVRLHFDHAYDGLRTSDGCPPRGFAVSAGAETFEHGNRGFEWAEARIEGDAVVVRSAKVADPVAVRYAWAQNPECNLVNSADLPAAPFRTDDWPGVTVKNA
jgi:sialate O-acetylesterase